MPAKFVCTVCGLEETFEPLLIDDRQPDSAELFDQARKRGWKINAFFSGPNRATCCSQLCADAFMASRSPNIVLTHPRAPAAGVSEQGRLGL